MVSINNLSYFIGGRPIYQDASIHIKAGDKIGLIGLNGTGKTTLLRLINQEYTADGGSISKSNDCTIGFLNQDLLSYESEESILTVAMQAFSRELAIQKKINQILKQMETAYSDEMVDKLTRLQDEFETLEGYTLQARAEEILEGIGFSTQDLERPLKEFSGGWRMRVMLAKLLLESPSLLMLDEPTNHLDLPSIQWIENYLKNYSGAYIIVSHDKLFLNNSVTKIVEVTGQQLITYEGNYSFYEQEKTLRNEIQKNAFENQQQKIKQTEKFINRFRAKASKARQVQSKVKSLEKMDKVDDVVDTNPSVDFNFNFRQQSGRYLIRLEEVSKAYGPIEIFDQSSALIERGDKIALIGANGKGKSTLLRILAGTESISGKREEGYNVNMAFYAQHQLEALHTDNEVLEELKQAGTGKTEQELRTILGGFLFSGEDVYKKIKVLSGGEKSRVALAKVLISEANFLILDEPTNHLDMQSVNILIQALQQYEGSFVIVSHDRYFISETANKIWYIEDKAIKEYPGTYEEYTYWVNKNNLEHKAEEKAVAGNTPEKSKKEAKPNITESENKEQKKQLKKAEKDLEELEQMIEKLETDKKQLELELTRPEVFENPDQLASTNQKYEAAQQNLEQLHQQWDELAEKIEELNQQI
ncbi:MAG: ribosomal protection-like ABC-F family protein [Candidatus Cyclobacteriaceae bacterium M3_2C_046]